MTFICKIQVRFSSGLQRFCIAAAKVVLGSAPETMMRDLEANGNWGLQSADGQTLLRTMDYIDYCTSATCCCRPR